EAAIILEVLHGGTVVGPTGHPFLMHDHAAGAAGRAAGHELHNLLPAIGAVQEQLGAVGRPAHVVGVVPDHVVGEGLAAADVYLHGLSGGGVVDQDIGDGIRGSGFRISLD